MVLSQKKDRKKNVELVSIKYWRPSSSIVKMKLKFYLKTFLKFCKKKKKKKKYQKKKKKKK